MTGADGNSLAGTWSFTGTNIIPTVNNKGYQAVFTPDDADNYNTVTRTITVKVTKATPVIAEKPTAGALTYGQKLSDSTLTGGKATYQTADGTEITGTFAWKNSSSTPTAADSKKTEYDVTFTPSDKDNYNAVDTKLTITVNKAAQAPNMPQAEMAPAHSTKKVGDITLPDGWNWQEADKDTALADGVAVTANAIYTGTDKGNYETESVSITITRSKCDHTHTEIRNQREATCTQTGYAGDTYCTDCDKLLSTGKELAALGHDYKATVTKQPTTTEEGSQNLHLHQMQQQLHREHCEAAGGTAHSQLYGKHYEGGNLYRGRGKDVYLFLWKQLHGEYSGNRTQLCIKSDEGCNDNRGRHHDLHLLQVRTQLHTADR